MLKASGAALAAGVAVAGAAWSVRGKSSAAFGPSVNHGSPGRRAVAITFDDGPSSSTPLFLEILAQFGVSATFFQVGSNALKHPGIARQVVDAGHEIGNHSQTHRNFALMSPSVIAEDFARAQDSLGDVTGKRPTLLRAPYGVRWFGFRAMQSRLGLTGVMWSVIGLDWKLPAAEVTRRILSRTRDGGIICLHDGRGTLENPDVSVTLEATRRIVPALIEAGYHFETVSQLLWPTI